MNRNRGVGGQLCQVSRQTPKRARTGGYSGDLTVLTMDQSGHQRVGDHGHRRMPTDADHRPQRGDELVGRPGVPKG